jgi:hypothetical protein
MDAGAIVAIVIGVALLVAAFVWFGRQARERRLESKRLEAHETRREARVSGAQAERQRAEADERAARARKEQAVAEEQSARAEKQHRFARERHERADELDPDVDGDGSSEREEHRTETHRERS